MTVILGTLALAVDMGRINAARAELQTAADATARYAATGLSSGTAAQRAATAAAESRIDGQALTLLPQDVQIGRWISGAFTVTNVNPNAVRVTAVRGPARNTPIALTFASLIGLSSPTMTARATVAAGGGGGAGSQSGSLVLDAKSSSFYAGMSDATRIHDPWGFDQVSDTRTTYVTQVPITPGNAMTFTASGWAAYVHWLSNYIQPGGQLNSIVTSERPSDYTGISPLRAPSMALIGVFLTDANPRSQATPALLDFSTAASREFSTLSPQIGQTFFIGTGVNSDGTPRKITVPAGATRLALGMNDGWVWRDNGGSYNVDFMTSARASVLVR